MKTNCPHCGQHFEVEEELAGRSVECSSCGKPFTISAPEPTKRCPMCGEEILAVAKKCRYCGEYLDDSNRPVQKKSRSAYVLLCLFLGGIGAHNFYIGQMWRGLVKIALFLAANVLFLQRNGIAAGCGTMIAFLNGVWVIMELFPDPNNKESIKNATLWQCIALGIFIVLAAIIFICISFGII